MTAENRKRLGKANPEKYPEHAAEFPVEEKKEESKASSRRK